jgi:hypothetical protein
MNDIKFALRQLRKSIAVITVALGIELNTTIFNLINDLFCARWHSRSCRALSTCTPATKRGVDLISDALPFGHLWYGEPDAISNAIGYAKFRSRSHNAVIPVYDEAGKVTETHYGLDQQERK